MESTNQNNYNNIATGIHLLTFGKWIFPLGNFVLPILLWMINSKKSDFTIHFIPHHEEVEIPNKK